MSLFLREPLEFAAVWPCVLLVNVMFKVHIYFPKKTADEEAMLSEALNVQPNSRLGCQIQINTEMDGLEVELAPEE